MSSGDPTTTVSVFLGGSGVDGGLDGPGQPTSSWFHAERTGRVEPKGYGLGFLDDPSPLIERAQSLGVDEVVLRLSWPWVAPQPRLLDETALRVTAEIVRHVREKGLTVAVVLNDGVVPGWLGEEAWLKPGTPEHFLRYAEAVLGYLGHDLTAVVTIEEPARFALAGMVAGSGPPFRIGNVADAVAATDAMLSAHALTALHSAEHFPLLECSYIASTTSGLDLESVVRGLPVEHRFASTATRWNPGRALSLFGGTPTVSPWISLGTLPESTGALRGAVSRLSSPRVAIGEVISSGEEAQGLFASSSFALRHAAGVLTHRSRKSALHGQFRSSEISSLFSLAKESNKAASRVVVGELVDRWVHGTYAIREGIFGVDRNRGPRGVTVLDHDAIGIDAAGELRQYLAQNR